MNKPVITVVVCTYNGEPYLPACLQSLIDQDADAATFEVIVVNNNSTDRSQEIIEKYCAGHENFRYVQETEVGLSAARNRGFHEAKGDYVSYLDDDAKATPNWISQALVLAKADYDLFGGPIHPYYDAPHIPWVKDEYNSYSLYETGDLQKGQYLSGSNIFIKYSLLEAYSGFNTELGMKGDSAGYHEETAFQLKAREDGKRIYYDKSLEVEHLVPAIKQNILYYLYSQYKSGKDGKYLWDAKYGYDELLGLFHDIDGVFMGMEAAVKERDTKEFPYPENYVVEKLVPMLFGIGSRMEYFMKHETVSLEEYLQYFVLSRGISLAEYLKIYEGLRGIELSPDELLKAFSALKQRDLQPAELMQAYRYRTSAGMLESLKNAVWMILLAKPIRQIIRKLRSN